MAKQRDIQPTEGGELDAERLNFKGKSAGQVDFSKKV
tara:strand:+ start:24851 stop:24961 length:111 start_codon:yes stop_codon:yes gene_type:complete